MTGFAYSANFTPKAQFRINPTKSKRRPPARVAPEKGAIIYAIYFNSRRLVKIGVTSRPRTRFRLLCQYMADDGFWFAAFYGSKSDERAAHKHFENWRAKGEFFRCNHQLVKEIEHYFCERGGRFREIDFSKPRFT